MDRIRVLVVDDDIRFRWAVMEALVAEESLEVVDEASDGNEAVEKARALKPHVALMDLYMPNCNGVEATRQLQAEVPDTRVLMFTVSEAEADLASALQAGARGYLLKNERSEQIVQAIHYVARGGILISPSMATKLLDELKTQKPAVGGIAGDAQVKSPAEAEVATEEKDKAIDRQATGKLQEESSKPPQEGRELLSSVSAAAPDDLVSDANLVLSPPLEPAIVLGLHQWLREAANGDVRKITAAWGGETVMDVSFREPVPLLRMLAGFPNVRAVIEEPYAGDRTRFADGRESPEGQKAGVQRRPPRQFRLALTAG